VWWDFSDSIIANFLLILTVNKNFENWSVFDEVIGLRHTDMCRIFRATLDVIPI